MLTMQESPDTQSFPFRIAEGAYDIMSRILRFPSVTGPEIDGQFCRITNKHDLQLSIKSEHWEEYQDDEMLQVRLLEDDSRDFIVLKSLVQHVEQPFAI